MEFVKIIIIIIVTNFHYVPQNNKFKSDYFLSCVALY